MFLCSNGSGEYILNHLVCDGTAQCFDGSDENNCTDITCTTEHGMFQCKDHSRCIPLSNYCDFRIDCWDNSDEDLCQHSPCTDEEFQCYNQQCIPSAARCDLLLDCADSTDEMMCSYCAANATFQCFDGTCISEDRQCDGIVDCPGALHEDESQSCVEANIEASCQQWMLKGKTSGYHIINPGT